MSDQRAPVHATEASVARTDATGRAGMLPELLAWSSSIVPDRLLVREDLLGSAAHVTMLARVGLISPNDAKQLRASLLRMFDAASEGSLALPDEEDVHMAIEALLTQELGDAGRRLHTARSRNDQVATALRMHVRDQVRSSLEEIALLAGELADRAAADQTVIMPAFTHRQRAQPVSAGFVVCAWCIQLLRAADVLWFAAQRANESPLGSGACSGTSLPIDRNLVAELLHFSGVTANALDAVGDRDFAIDFAWGGARVLLALSRLATDVIDFTTHEFGYLAIGDGIAAGSSMMPQKKNPDIFELVRAKSARGVGHVASMLTLVKGLPTGYARDLQDDREAVLDTGPLLRGAVRAVRTAMGHLTFRPERCLQAVSDGSTQATDVAEALARKGIAFREAYKATGQLVQFARDSELALAKVSLEQARNIHPAFDAAVLSVLDPRKAVAAKQSPGGTSPERVTEQIAWIRAAVQELGYRGSTLPPLEQIRSGIEREPLSR